MMRKIIMIGAVAALSIGPGVSPESRALLRPASAIAETETDIPMRPLWGDTHLHTSNSADAFAGGNRLSPADALRFARGDEVTSSSGIKAKLARPLDFLVVADHSDAIGVTADLYNTPAENIADPTLRRWRNMMHGGATSSYLATREMISAFLAGTAPTDISAPEKLAAATRRVWDGQIAAVERYNQPNRFTTMHGFEYSLAIKGNSLHRNVIFRDNADRAAQVVPFPAEKQKGPEALWDYMDAYEKKTGGQMLAIPHNSNLSNGLYFSLDGPDGTPLTAEQAKRRAHREPLVEATQYKGDSESHPFLSRNDEFADFGDAGWENGNAPLSAIKKPEMFAGEYVRSALKRGLDIQRRTGVNPYAFGLIGSTDSHTGLSTADENNFFGKMVVDEPNDGRMLRAVNPTVATTRRGHQYLAGGLAAVWASSNTRTAIFDAMARRETYATTGTRMTVRLFAGWRFSGNVFADDWVRHGYAQGVPMGGVLGSKSGVPRFIIQAMKDPMGANLDRIQIVKGWIDAKGVPQERIFDVSWSEPERRKISNGRLTPVGNSVDLATATYANTIGAVELRTLWRDPEYTRGQKAFYYARVLEIPTPRWTLFDAVRFKIAPPKDARLVDQERAYTSPIWVG
jgi:Protein of unknown function (DUF3604)